MRQLLSALFIIPVLAWGTVASAQDQARDFSPDSARVYRASAGESLAPPSGGSPFDVVTDFLRGQGQSDATANSLVVESSSTDSRSGVTHTRLRQQVAGMTVYGTYVRASATADGRLISVAENLEPITPAALVLAQITQAEALVAVLAEWYPTFTDTLPEVSTIGNTTEFEGGTFFFKNPTVTRVVVPMASGALHGGYLVTTWDDDDNMLRHTVVGRTGNILAVQNRTSADSYLIFPINPDESNQTQTTALAQPVEWVDPATNTTSGPNVIAYLDQDNDDNLDDVLEQPSAIPPPDPHDFLYPVDFAQDLAATSDNEYAAVVNLFYQNNILHDVLAGHGFTQAFGNFEGDDPVLAEAQDGEGMNNANFATEVDGTSSRMQMYLWDLTPTATGQRRDGSLDYDIIAHEYGHGVTWRMVLDMSGPFGGASGEGFSDVLATWLTDEDRVAEYSSGWADGIRSTGYGSHTGTYADFSGASVHSDGEIYAATMWDLRTDWMAQGWDESELFDVAVSGLSFTIGPPAFEEMRDGLLLAIDNYPTWDAQEITDRKCLVWETYAARGIGDGADGRLRRTGKRYRLTITESYTVPAACEGDPPSNSDPVANAGGPYSGSVNVPVSFDGSGSSDPDQDSLTYSWDFGDGSAGSGQSPSHTYSTANTFTVMLTVNDGNGGVDSDTALVTVTDGSTGGITLQSAVGSKTKGVKETVLAWTWDADATYLVYVFRNGSQIPSSPTGNDGAHIDVIGNGGGKIFTYKVCEDGSMTTCSNELTVVF